MHVCICTLYAYADVCAGVSVCEVCIIHGIMFVGHHHASLRRSRISHAFFFHSEHLHMGIAAETSTVAEQQPCV
jgi:hypothetical protein